MDAAKNAAEIEIERRMKLARKLIIINFVLIITNAFVLVLNSAVVAFNASHPQKISAPAAE